MKLNHIILFNVDFVGSAVKMHHHKNEKKLGSAIIDESFHSLRIL